MIPYYEVRSTANNNVAIFLVIIASIISTLGVVSNNVMLDHVLAMRIWRWSNIIFWAYFFGRWRKWWDGGIPDAIMTGLYTLYIITNELGLHQIDTL